MGQRIGLDLDRVIRVGSRQADLTSAFRPYDTSIQCPRSRRWIELGACLGTADWILALAGLQIRSVKTRIAFPEERCLNSVVAGNEGLLVFPDTTNTKMILKVLSHPWKMLDNRYAQALQVSLIANPRQVSLIANPRKHQHLWRVHRAQRQNNFKSSRNALNFSLKSDLHTGGSLSL